MSLGRTARYFITQYFGKLLFAASLCLVESNSAQAARFEKAFGLGPVFYSGSEKSAVVPPYAFQFSFAANHLATKRFNLVNRFTLALMFGGTDFAGKYGAYNGIAGTYEMGGRINLAKNNVQPFLVLGPAVGMYVAQLSSAPASSSKNQTALKYGYWFGTGFDMLKDENGRGQSSGWGLELSFFNMLRGPSLFEFATGGLTATGIKFEFRYILKPSG